MAGRTGGRGGNNVVPMNAAAVATRRAKALELRVAGHTPVEIAAQLKVPLHHVETYIADALAMLPPPDVDEARRLELARLDQMSKALAPQIAHGNPDAIRAAIPVTQERMKIIGGYAASKVDAVVTHQTEADRQLAELLAQTRAEVAARERSIVDAEVVEGGASA